jgi:carboxypeptidase C (cathepsin A)
MWFTEHHNYHKGQKISYKATTGTMPVWDEDGKKLDCHFLYLL